MNVIGWVGGVHKCPYMVMWNEECHWMMVHKVRRRARRRSSVFCMEKEFRLLYGEGEGVGDSP